MTKQSFFNTHDHLTTCSLNIYGLYYNFKIIKAAESTYNGKIIMSDVLIEHY